MKNYYEVLGVPPAATDAEIKSAYHKLARQYHPDLGGDGARFDAVNEAYKFLCDPVRRMTLDAVLRVPHAARHAENNGRAPEQEKAGDARSAETVGRSSERAKPGDTRPAASAKGKSDRSVKAADAPAADNGDAAGNTRHAASVKAESAASDGISAARVRGDDTVGRGRASDRDARMRVLEEQVEEYERLLLSLARCSVSPPRPELSPASLSLLVRKNRSRRKPGL